jgi:hypothetical protein
MAIATKVNTQLRASASLSAGSTFTSSDYDVHTAIESAILVLVTNGGTPPSAGATITVNVGSDGSTYPYVLDTFTAGVGTSAAYSFVIQLPDWVMHAQLVVKNNDGTTNAITVQADGDALTAIG